MRSATRETAAPLVCFLAAALLALTVTSEGATLKHKETGQVIKGTLLNQRISNLRVFKKDDGGTQFINPDEWEVVEADAPAATAETPKPDKVTPAAPAPTDPPEADPNRVFMIPISGPIKEHCLTEGIERALKEAKVRKAGVIVFHVDTPGGYAYLAEQIIQRLEGVDWATTVAWVEGGEQQALSAGAYICLATHKILMAPGTTLGAATPYHVTWTGSAEVDEKFKSAFRAKFRGLAERRGHSPVIADAMVDKGLSAVQVWLDEKQLIVTEDEAKRLRDEHATEKRFKRGKTIVKEGKLLTLTSQEAVEFKVACGIAATEGDLLKQLGCDDAEIVKADWLPSWVKQTDEKRTKAVETHRTLFSHHFRQTIREDPRQQRYYVNESGRFVDGGQSWKDHTDRCLAHLKRCASALKELEKLLKDKRYGSPLSEEALKEMKMDMETIYRRLRRERISIRPP